MALKDYVSDRPNLAVTVVIDGKADTIYFVNGKFSTANAAEQEAIEESENFRTQHVRNAPSAREALVTAADAAAKAAGEAKADSDAASKALADFDAANAAATAA